VNRVAPFNLQRSTALQQLGRFDPTAREGSDFFEKTFFHRRERVTVRLHHAGDKLFIEGPESMVAHWQWPPDDGYDSFAPNHPHLRRLHARSGLRIFPVPWLFDVAAGAVLQQRVRFVDACEDWRRIVEQLSDGEAFPAAEDIARMGTWEFQQLGIDAQRARTLRALAREQVFAQFLSPGHPRERVRLRLQRIPGIGPWTTAMVMGFGLGDTDALITGDVHLPRIVCEALGGMGGMGGIGGQAGQPAQTQDPDDSQMMALLQPFAGQRFRVCRLLLAASLGGGVASR